MQAAANLFSAWKVLLKSLRTAHPTFRFSRTHEFQTDIDFYTHMEDVAVLAGLYHTQNPTPARLQLTQL